MLAGEARLGLGEKEEARERKGKRLKELRLRLFNKGWLRLPDKGTLLAVSEVIHAQPEKPKSQKIAIKKVELRCKASPHQGPHA